MSTFKLAIKNGDPEKWVLVFFFGWPHHHAHWESGFDRHAKCTVLRESQMDLDIFLEKKASRVHLNWPLRMAILKNQFWSFFSYLSEDNSVSIHQKWICVAVCFVFVRSLYVDVHCQFLWKNIQWLENCLNLIAQLCLSSENDAIEVHQELGHSKCGGQEILRLADILA